MITVNDISMNFSGQTLFKHVDLKFVPGNCYGIIGANGAGKSTFLRILSGDLEPTTGEVIIPKEERMSILKQDHFQYDAYTVLDTVIMGNQHLYDVMKEKDALYEKEDFTDEDGVKASELEAEFAEMNGWEAESDVSRLIQGLGLSNDILYSEMSTLTAKEILAYELTKLVHGEEEANKAQETARGLFSGKGSLENMPSSQLSADKFENGKIGAINLLVACGRGASNGEARRLIQQGGVAVNDQKVASIDVTFDQSDFEGDGVVIKKGKKVFHRAYI